MRAAALPTLLLSLFASAPALADDDPLAAVEKRQEALFDKIGPSVVFISADDAFGSGFFVGEDGLILTSGHVVGKKEIVRVVTLDGKTWQGRVIERAAGDVDLALVRIAQKDSPALPLASNASLRVGSWVASVGHGRGGIWSFNTGMVSNIYPDGSDRPVFQTQIPLNPGGSGGPIVDRHGRVVGVVTAGLRDSNSINFAIRSEVAVRTLSKLSGIAPSLTITAPAGVPIFVDGKLAGTGPRVIIPATERSYDVFGVISGQMKKVTVRFPERREVDLQ